MTWISPDLGSWLADWVVKHATRIVVHAFNGEVLYVWEPASERLSVEKHGVRINLGGMTSHPSSVSGCRISGYSLVVIGSGDDVLVSRGVEPDAGIVESWLFRRDASPDIIRGMRSRLHKTVMKALSDEVITRSRSVVVLRTSRPAYTPEDVAKNVYYRVCPANDYLSVDDSGFLMLDCTKIEAKCGRDRGSIHVVDEVGMPILSVGCGPNPLGVETMLGESE